MLSKNTKFYISLQQLGYKLTENHIVTTILSALGNKISELF